MQEQELRSKLRAWILSHAKSQPKSGLTDQTMILEEGVLSSLDIAEFVLYIESLRGEERDNAEIERRPVHIDRCAERQHRTRNRF